MGHDRPVCVGNRGFTEEAVELIPFAFPHRHDQRFRVLRIEPRINHPGLVVYEKYLGPILPAVGGFEQPTIFVRPVKPSHRTGVNDVRVLRVNQNLADLERLVQAHVLEGLARIGALVNAVTIRDGVSRVRFTAADPHNVRVRRCDRNVTNRDRALLVENDIERGAVVHGLQQPAGAGGDVVSRWLGLHDGHRGDPPRHVRRADLPPRVLLADAFRQGAFRHPGGRGGRRLTFFRRFQLLL